MSTHAFFRRLRVWSASLFVAAVFISSATGDARAGFLYVLNDESTGSNIYGFRVNESTGALTALTGFPISPGNGGLNSIVSERMVVDAQNKRLYVINDTSDSVAAYSINPSTGAISPMPFSPISLGAGNWNSIAVHPGGTPLIVSNGLTNAGSLSYNITATTATPAVGNPFLVGATSAFSSTFSRNGSYFYVGGNTGTVIAGFSVNTSTGVLTALPGSPFAAGGTSTIAYAMDTAGRFFGVDNAFNIRIFTTPSGVLTPVTGNPFPSGMTQRRFGLIHPNQDFYIVAGNTGNNVGVYQISGSGSATTVAAVTGSPFATGGTTANCLAITASGNFLYVANRVTRNVTTFSVNSSTGALTNIGVQPSNTLGSVGWINGCAYYAPKRARADFDGDARTDVSVFRESEGNWYLNQSASGVAVRNWGISDDIPTPGDFDGDDKTDIAIFRPSTGQWWILRSSDSVVQLSTFGTAGDLPVAGDWDGDTLADVAVYRPSTSVWYIQNSGGGTTITLYGSIGDTPVSSDYDGDGRMDLAIFRPTNNQWWIRRSSNQTLTVTTFGLVTDKLVPADYDGDSRSEIAVFRPSNGAWYMIRTTTGSFTVQGFGLSGDVPVPGDYDGDGLNDLAIYRNGVWWINGSTAGVSTVTFGNSTDIPIPAKYIP